MGVDAQSEETEHIHNGFVIRPFDLAGCGGVSPTGLCVTCGPGAGGLPGLRGGIENAAMVACGERSSFTTEMHGRTRVTFHFYKGSAW